jgi:hypothetical protein
MHISSPLMVVLAMLAWFVILVVVGSWDIPTLRTWIGPLYILQTIAIVTVYGAITSWRTLEFFKPTMLTVCYLGLSMGLGAMFYASDAVVRKSTLVQYHRWTTLDVTYTVISGVLLLLFFAAILGRRRSDIPTLHPVTVSLSWPFLLAVGVLLLLSVVGLRGAYAPMVWAPLACTLFFVLFRARAAWRWLVVLIIVALIAAVSAESKRNAVFLLLPAMILEAIFGSRRINLKWLAFGFPLVVAVSALILAMSQMRGINNQTGFLQALSNVLQYATSQQNLALVSNNFELGYVFFHSHDAVNAGLTIPHVRTHGETYLKALFVGVPQSLVSWKPASFVEAYTDWHDPQFRAAGGSWAATAIGEAFWNFGSWGLVGISALLVFLDRSYFFLIGLIRRNRAAGAVIALVAIENTMLYIRGSGLDVLLSYTYASAAVCVLVILPLAMTFDRASYPQVRPGEPARRAQRRPG